VLHVGSQQPTDCKGCTVTFTVILSQRKLKQYFITRVAKPTTSSLLTNICTNGQLHWGCHAYQHTQNPSLVPRPPPSYLSLAAQKRHYHKASNKKL